MKKTLSVLLVTALALSACGNSRKSKSATTAPTTDAATALVPQRSGKGLLSRPDRPDLSVPIAVISELRVDPTSTGAIIYVEGIASRQGAFNAELRPVISEENTKNGILAYTFRVVYPEGPTPQGPERSRTIVEAVDISNQDLQGVRLVRVIGQQNTLDTRRR